MTRCDICERIIPENNTTHCDECNRVCCPDCISTEYHNFSYYDGNVDITEVCDVCKGVYGSGETPDQPIDQDKPYTCLDCKQPLDFPHAFFLDGFTYCSNCLPSYDKHQQW